MNLSGTQNKHTRKKIELMIFFTIRGYGNLTLNFKVNNTNLYELSYAEVGGSVIF